MFAVFQTGGKQYKAEIGRTFKVENLPGDIGDEVIFDHVLMCSGDGAPRIGSPRLETARVVARILGHGKTRKVWTQKHIRRKGYRRIHGHRQQYTEIEITSIDAG